MKNVATIGKRILIEFGLPCVISIVWMISEVGMKGAVTEYVKQFGVAFFMASWVWGQLLRIIYQQDQKVLMAGLGGTLGAVAKTIEGMRATVAELIERVPPDLRDELRALLTKAQTADSQIKSAHSDYQAASPSIYRSRLGLFGRQISPPMVQ